MAHTALGAATEIHRTAQDLVGIAGQDTGGVHLAQGIFADLDGDIVVIQHVIVSSEVDGVQVVLALVVVLQRAGAADGDLAAQLDAHLLHPGTGGLLDGNSAPAAGVVAQQLHLYQFHVGALGGVDAHERSGHAVLGIAAQHLHDGQAAALGGVDGQAAQRAGVGLVQLYLKDGGRLDGNALAHGEMLFHVGVFGQEGIGGDAHSGLGKGLEDFSLRAVGADARRHGGGGSGSAPAIGGDLRQGGLIRGKVYAQVVPGRHRQTVHVHIHTMLLPSQPMLPFISRWMRLFISTAYSSGSSLAMGSAKPPTISARASSSEMPRLIR